jgi:hypothetical protein
MTTPSLRTDLPLEVLAEIGLLLLRHRRDPTPLVLSDTIDDIIRAQPDFRLSREAVGDAIIEGASASRLNVYSNSIPSLALTDESDRMDDDGAPAQ